MPTPTAFAMRLPEGMISRLAATEWGRQLFGYRLGKDHLFIAVRDGYLSVYVNGRAVFKKVEEKNGRLVASFDQRYLLGKGHPSGDLYFDGEKVFRKGDDNNTCIKRDDSPQNFSAWVDRVRNYDLVNLDDDSISGDAEDLREKDSLARHALRPEVINLEMALPGSSRKNDDGEEVRIAPRIDMVHLAEKDAGASAELVFTEAKLFSNRALRSASSNNRTIKQILGYRAYLEAHRTPICEAYRQACKHLVDIRRHQGVEVHSLLSGVVDGTASLSLRAMPDLLIFKPPSIPEVSEKAWKAHAASFAENGIPIRYS